MRFYQVIIPPLEKHVKCHRNRYGQIGEVFAVLITILFPDHLMVIILFLFEILQRAKVYFLWVQTQEWKINGFPFIHISLLDV